MALVRSPEKATTLRELDCELVEGDLSDAAAIARGVEGAEAAIHAGAVYKVGVPKSEHAAMFEANVAGTERVLDAAISAGVSKIVYVSTCAVFGDTHGQVVDGGLQARQPVPERVRAHQDARPRARRGPDRRAARRS